MKRRTDTVSRTKRSDIMRAVRSHGNKSTELMLIRIFRNHKVSGWRRRTNLAGDPDFVFSRHRIAVFVDGCFWHGCARHCRMPTGNRSYWNGKIASNIVRDKRVNRLLRRCGWRVVRVWEHELTKNPGRCIRRIKELLEVKSNIGKPKPAK